MTQETNLLPADLNDALLVGRVWRGAPVDGPAVVAVRRGRLVDITRHAATVETPPSAPFKLCEWQ